MPDYIGTSDNEEMITVRKRGDSFPRLSIEADGTVKTGLGLKPATDVFNDFSRFADPKSLSIKLMSSPPTIGSVTTTTGIASANSYLISGGTEVSNINSSFWTNTVGGPYTLGGSYPSYLFARPQSSYDGQPGSTICKVEFLVDCTVFEFFYHGQSGQWRMWVDDELISTAGVGIPNNNLLQYQPVTFGSKAIRKITIEAYNFRFGGVIVGPTDSVMPAPATTKPRCLIIGDSFVDGTGSEQVNGVGPQLGAYMGWDVWVAGQGASGFAAAGSGTGKYAVRIPYYANVPFDIIVICGSINDTSSESLANTVSAEATTAYGLINQYWPNALKIAVAPLIPHQPSSSWVYAMYIARDAIRAAARAAGFYHIDPCEMPLAQPIVGGTLLASTAVSATTFTTNQLFINNTVIEIGSGATAERRVVTTTSGVNPTTVTVPALGYAHAAGESWNIVGQSWIRGSGRETATTGSGNRDLYITSDNTHPSSAGHDALAKVLAELICYVVRT